VKAGIHSIAVVMTCHNRKDMTVACIRSLYDAHKACLFETELSVYLTDDGSTDGTRELIGTEFPRIRILTGSGTLYWAGGMRKAWLEALVQDFDAYLLLNDDTTLYLDGLTRLLQTHQHSMAHYGTGGVYIGSVHDPDSGAFTYGGRMLVNKWLFTTLPLIPDESVKECDLGNCNIMLVHCSVVRSIGIFSKRYIHAKADHDYTLSARRKGLPVLVSGYWCGTCRMDHPAPKPDKMNLRKRIHFLMDPKGIEFRGYMHFMWKFFPLRAPFVWISLMIKTIAPQMGHWITVLIKRI
jgi:GT2 family glycosyltransferase